MEAAAIPMAMPDDPRLAEAARGETSAYVHIPFCARVCPYCDFAVVAGREDLTDRYLSALVAEVAMEPPAGTLGSVFIGGGTPSRLSPQQVARILGSLSDRFGFGPSTEVTLEANPEDWTQNRSDGMLAAGVTRLSFGAQSFDREILHKLGRIHQPEDIKSAVLRARRTGFRSLSLDLIFGQPDESLSSWQHTLDEACATDPDHISTYALTVERGTALSRSVAAGAKAPDDDDQADKYLVALEQLERHGYRRYEVSNFARPGHTCGYNLTTWAQGDYLAFGLGAHGHRKGIRRRNVRRLDAYLQEVEAGRRPEAGSERIDGWAAEQERLMLGLRRSAGVVIGAGGKALLASAPGGRLVDAGVLQTTSDRLVVEQPLLTDSVIREVLGLAEPSPAPQVDA